MIFVFSHFFPTPENSILLREFLLKYLRLASHSPSEISYLLHPPLESHNKRQVSRNLFNLTEKLRIHPTDNEDRKLSHNWKLCANVSENHLMKHI